jgi:hypothetical protein
MNRSRRTSKALAAILCLALTPGTLLAAIPATAATVFHFQRESMQQFQRQLAASEIHATTFNKVAHTLHLSMNDHRHLLVSYPPLEYKKIVASLEAKNIPVAVEKHAKVAAKPAHHKLRYIVGAVLVVVILIVLAVLLMGRRRSLLENERGSTGEAGGQSAGSSSADSG